MAETGRVRGAVGGSEAAEPSVGHQYRGSGPRASRRSSTVVWARFARLARSASSSAIARCSAGHSPSVRCTVAASSRSVTSSSRRRRVGRPGHLDDLAGRPVGTTAPAGRPASRGHARRSPVAGRRRGEHHGLGAHHQVGVRAPEVTALTLRRPSARAHGGTRRGRGAWTRAQCRRVTGAAGQRSSERVGVVDEDREDASVSVHFEMLQTRCAVEPDEPAVELIGPASVGSVSAARRRPTGGCGTRAPRARTDAGSGRRGRPASVG